MKPWREPPCDLHTQHSGESSSRHAPSGLQSKTVKPAQGLGRSGELLQELPSGPRPPRLVTSVVAPPKSSTVSCSLDACSSAPAQVVSGCAAGLKGKGGDGLEQLESETVRPSQSALSVPQAQEPYELPGPPSSQSSSFAYWQVSEAPLEGIGGSGGGLSGAWLGGDGGGGQGKGGGGEGAGHGVRTVDRPPNSMLRPMVQPAETAQLTLCVLPSGKNAETERCTGKTYLSEASHAVMHASTS